MAEAQTYEDANPPPTGMINASEEGVIWKRPDGTFFRATREGFFPLTPEQAAPYFAAPAPAGVQAEALAGVPAPPAAAAPAGGGDLSARDASQLAVKTRGNTTLVDASEVERANTEAAVQGAMARERAATAGPLGALSLPERGQVAKLLQTGEAANEEEAAKLIIAARPKAAEQGAALQER